MVGLGLWLRRRTAKTRLFLAIERLNHTGELLRVQVATPYSAQASMRQESGLMVRCGYSAGYSSRQMVSRLLRTPPHRKRQGTDAVLSAPDAVASQDHLYNRLISSTVHSDTL